MSRGGFVALAYTDDDPDSDARTQLFADTDGNLATAGDQHPLSEVRPERNGTPQAFVRELQAVPEASYAVLGVIDDGVNEPVPATGPGRIDVANLAWGEAAGGGSFDVGLGVTTLADGSSVVTGQFLGTATFGQGDARQTSLVSAGDLDVFVARFNADGGF